MELQTVIPATIPFVHFSDFAGEGKVHIVCTRPWANESYTEKDLLSRGIKRAGSKLYTTDKGQVTCPECQKSMGN